MHVISGTSSDSVGMMIGGHYSRNNEYPITGEYTAIAWLKDNKMLGQAIFNDYTGANIEIHVNMPGILNRRTFTHICEYVFNQCKCKRLTAKPLCTNEKLLSLLERLGFVYEFTQKDYYVSQGKYQDAVVYKLTSDNLPKWVKLNGLPKTEKS